MEMVTEVSVSGSVALGACAAMAFCYVAILYAPTLILRLPPPNSLYSFMIRRFICVFISSVVSVLACGILLGIGKFRDVSSVLGVYGIRKDHMWQAVIFPLFLTSLMYTGSLVSESLLLVSAWKEGRTLSCGGVCFCECARIAAQRFLDQICECASNALAWRTYVVAPFTEEVVFRACMIPLLLCGGFKTYSIIFFSPIFFSLAWYMIMACLGNCFVFQANVTLMMRYIRRIFMRHTPHILRLLRFLAEAHLNHFLELYCQQRYSFLKAFLVVGLQLGYTVIFGWYASFLFIRTGNLISPIVAHIFCNVMGLPVLLSSRTKGAASIAFAAGLVCFIWLLFPATSPDLYNDRRNNCSCWHRYCSWN